MADFRRKTSRIAALRAGLAGRFARRDGRSVTECPFDPAGDPTQKFLARFWIMGWNRSGRPIGS